MAEGRLVYSGPSSKIVSYFEHEAGFKYCPSWSPPDFALEAVSRYSFLRKNTLLIGENSKGLSCINNEQQGKQNQRENSIVINENNASSIDVIANTYAYSENCLILCNKITTLLSDKQSNITLINAQAPFDCINWLNKVYVLTKVILKNYCQILTLFLLFLPTASISQPSPRHNELLAYSSCKLISGFVYRLYFLATSFSCGRYKAHASG